MLRSTLILTILAVCSADAVAQSLNIDFGPPNTGPTATYAAAGLPGVWNSIEGQHTTLPPQIVYDLVGLNGQPTFARLHQFGGTELLLTNDPSVSGNDAILLNDALVTHTIPLESCLFINGLQPGTYEVLTYAWMPNHPEIASLVRLDFNPNLIHVGGDWPGAHQHGITYARHTVEVTTGFLGLHSGIPAGGNTTIGAALNGMQIRKLEACLAPQIVNGQSSTTFAQTAFDGYVDPRLESNNGQDLNLGLDQITLLFNTPVRDWTGDELTAASFFITQTGPQLPPAIVALETEDNQRVTLSLDRRLSVDQWTTLRADLVSVCGGQPLVGFDRVRVGFLPGDIDQNAVVQPLDLLRFRQMLAGTFFNPFGIRLDYADTDRNGDLQPLDLLRFRQLLNGSPPATQAWSGQALPPIP